MIAVTLLEGEQGEGSHEHYDSGITNTWDWRLSSAADLVVVV